MILACDAGPDAAPTETLGAADLGLPDSTSLPFEFTAAEAWSPLVISFPHVGLDWPDDEPQRRPAVNFARNADLAVDRLYPDAARIGAATVKARYSRLLIDLNRAADDVTSTLVPDHPAPRPHQPPWAQPGPNPPAHNRGLIWQTAVGNVQILRAPLPFADLQARLSRYYDPYHAALELLLARRRARFGFAVLLDAHSMPGSVPGDLVLGTFEGGACSPELERRALAALRGDDPAGGLRVSLNDPYRGGELVRRFGRPEHGVHALQLEVNRALYMDEVNLVLRPELSAQLSAPSGPAASRPSTPAQPDRFTRPGGSRTTDHGPSAAALLLLHRVKSLVTALAGSSLHDAAAPVRPAFPASPQPADEAAPGRDLHGTHGARPGSSAHRGEPLCRRTPRG